MNVELYFLLRRKYFIAVSVIMVLKMHHCSSALNTPIQVKTYACTPWQAFRAIGVN